MPLPPDATLGDAGEFGLIGELTALFPQGEQVLVGPGDDAAVLRVKTGHVVVSTDLMVEGRHFRRDWASAEDVGHRAAAQNLSDLNAMGGRAHSLTVGLAAPADLPVAWALEFAAGFAAECELVGASVVGGDLTSADQVVVAVTVIGACTAPPVLRSGASAGDVLALAGRQGWAAGGLAVLGRGFRSPRVLVEAYRRPVAAVRRRAGGRRGRRDVDDRHLRRPARGRRTPGLGVRGRDRRAHGLLEIPEPLHAVAAPPAPTRLVRARRRRRPRAAGDVPGGCGAARGLDGDRGRRGRSRRHGRRRGVRRRRPAGGTSSRERRRPPPRWGSGLVGR